MMIEPSPDPGLSLSGLSRLIEMARDPMRQVFEGLSIEKLEALAIEAVHRHDADRHEPSEPERWPDDQSAPDARAELPMIHCQMCEGRPVVDVKHVAASAPIPHAFIEYEDRGTVVILKIAHGTHDINDLVNGYRCQTTDYILPKVER
jgi:hypothetical protein